MKRTANRQGSWRKRDGRWEYRLQVEGQDVSASGRTKTEALERMEEKIARIKEGKPRTDAKITVAEHVGQWLRLSLAARTTKRGLPLAESTKRMYRTLAEHHITGRTDGEHPERNLPTPAVGQVRLDRIKPMHVEAMVTSMRDAGLAESTIRTTYHILRLALDHAVDNDLLAKNPAHKVTRPGKSGDDTPERPHLTRDELLRVLEAAKDYRYHEALTLIAQTGIRRGEALALKWDDVDLVDGTVSISGTLARIDGELTVTQPKTRKAHRTVYLTPRVVDQLALLRDTQEAERDALKGTTVVIGGKKRPAYTETGYVFTTETGQPVDPRNVFRTMQQAAKKVGIKGVGIHTLRHTYLSLAANNGQPLANLQDLAGHSDIRITRSYIHNDSEVTRNVGMHVGDLLGL